jgi:hypothetical protein
MVPYSINTSMYDDRSSVLGLNMYRFYSTKRTESRGGTSPGRR